MTDSVLRHKGCKGHVFADASGIFRLSTPSMSFTPDGLRLPVLEVSDNPAGGQVAFFCSTCNKNVDFEKEVEVICLVCNHAKPVDKCFCSYEIPIACEECLNVARGKTEPKTEAHRKIQQFLRLPEDVRFIKFSETLRNVSF